MRRFGAGRFSINCVDRAQLRFVGSIDLLDLKVITEFYGSDFLPYPLMCTEPAPFETADQASAHATAVMERFSVGDLSIFVEYMATFATADIRAASHVQYISHDIPSVRILAHRTGSLGFFTEQRADADVLDVYALSPYELGAAIRDAVPLTQPGMHSEIVVPEYSPRPRVEFDTEDIVVRHIFDSPSEVTMPSGEVSAYAIVQSHWRPMRKWGPDREKRMVVWIQVRDDGDYIYEPDMSFAKPMSRSILHERIERLIAEDAAILREIRRG